MARRKKEPEGYHREQIAAAAEQLFASQGVRQTTMDDIAKTAQYSKATLYVYFRNKEEIVGELTRKSMQFLYEHLTHALKSAQTTRNKYDEMCKELVCYQSQYPFYFKMVLGEIPFGYEQKEEGDVYQKTYEVGERINEAIAEMIQEGIDKGDLREDLSVMQTVFVFWSALSGVIQLSSDKREYLEQRLQITREAYLRDGFELLYQSIERRDTRCVPE